MLLRRKYALLACWFLAVGMLMTTLFDIETGTFCVLWLANLKYITRETNGANTLAAVLFVLSLIALQRLPSRWRIPVALLLLYLASLAHPILRLSFGIVCAWLIARTALAWRRGAASPPIAARLKYYLLPAAVAVLLTVLVHTRARDDGLDLSYRKVLRFSFAVNHVDRKQLHDRYTDAWAQSDEVIGEVFPTATSVAEAVRENPREVAAHLVYNTGQTVCCLVALVFGSALGLGLPPRFFYTGGSANVLCRRSPGCVRRALDGIVVHSPPGGDDHDCVRQVPVRSGSLEMMLVIAAARQWLSRLRALARGSERRMPENDPMAISRHSGAK